MNPITPTVGRIVWYRGNDNVVRAAIVAAVHGIFCLNLYVFGKDQNDTEAGLKTSVTHADATIETSCFPSWDWMPYQKQQAEKHSVVECATAELQPAIATEDAIEAEIQAKGLNAPRLTPADIDRVIIGDDYHRFNGTTVTICCLYLENGFTVTGESACASPENFDEEIGRKIARANAREKIWQLEGYLLRQNLFIQEQIDSGALEVVSIEGLSPHNTVNS